MFRTSRCSSSGRF